MVKTWEVLSVLFRKKITRSCAYCLYGSKLDENAALCVKKGLCTQQDGCRKFKYDPLKRIPVRRRAMDFSKYSQEDFSL